jgi:hypothetical protein
MYAELYEREKGGTEWKEEEKGTIEYLCANYFQNCDVILPITSRSLEQVTLRLVSPIQVTQNGCHNHNQSNPISR